MPSDDDTAAPRAVAGSSGTADLVSVTALLRRHQRDLLEGDGHVESEDFVFCPRQARSISPEQCARCDAQRYRTPDGDVVCELPSEPQPAPAARELTTLAREVMVGAIMGGVTCVRDLTPLGAFLELHPQHDFAVAVDYQGLPLGAIWTGSPLPRGFLARNGVRVVEIARTIGIVAEAAPLVDALRVMARTHARQLCVVAGGGAVVGALSDIAALRSLVALRHHRPL